MSSSVLRLTHLAAAVAGLSAVLVGCTSSPSWLPSFSSSSDTPPPAASAAGSLPPAFAAEELVGRWGYAAYHKDADRPRIEKAAKGQCGQPYIISRGTSGGVMMYLADQSKLTELRTKGATSGKTYLGPPDSAPGDAQDREVVSFDGRVLVLKWVDTEVAGRYGTAVYVRCDAAAGTAKRQ